MAVSKKTFTIPLSEKDVADYVANHITNHISDNTGVLGDDVTRPIIDWSGAVSEIDDAARKWRELYEAERARAPTLPPRGGTSIRTTSQVDSDVSELRKVTKHQAAIIEDLQKQVAELNHRLSDLSDQIKHSHPLHGRF
jgi:methyl-accepting chemotaxis protein